MNYLIPIAIIIGLFITIRGAASLLPAPWKKKIKGVLDND
jgi:hypothetical protein